MSGIQFLIVNNIQVIVKHLMNVDTNVHTRQILNDIPNFWTYVGKLTIFFLPYIDIIEI